MLTSYVVHHPVVIQQAAARYNDYQLRIADIITGFAGSMKFVYLHIALFAVWMLVLERSPWPTLTLVVSLEAIFLSTFVMIGQNRQAAFHEAKADHDFVEQEAELKTNTELTRAIHELTLMTFPFRRQSCSRRPARAPRPSAGRSRGSAACWS